MPKIERRLAKYLNSYHIWDSAKMLEFLPSSQYLDVTVTSPPYWNLKDYGSEKQIGFGQTYNQSLESLAKVFENVYAITKKTGSLWIVSDTIKYKGKLLTYPFDMAQKLEKIGWHLQDVIIWNKDKTLPWSHQGKLRNIFEFITFFTKTDKFKYRLSRIREVSGLKQWWIKYPERYSPLGKAPSRAWEFPIPTQGSWSDNWVRHFNPLPLDMVDRIIKLTTDPGDIVLDPFSGSGMVLAQAEASGRKFIGFDLNRKYKEMYEKSVRPRVLSQSEELSRLAEEKLLKKRSFSKLIDKLRKLKFGRELARLSKIAFKSPAPVRIYVISPSKRSLFLHFALQEKKIPASYRKDIEQVINRAPLSKYGIKPSFSWSSSRQGELRWLRKRGLRSDAFGFCYLNNRTHFYKLKGKYSDLSKQTSKEGSGVVVISNLGVRVNNNQLNTGS